MSNVSELMHQVREGMHVYYLDGQKLGEVGEVNIGTHIGEPLGQSVTEERSFFQVRRGPLGLGSDLYVPAEQVQGVSDDRITLSCSSDEVVTEAWGTRPSTPEPGARGDRDTASGDAPLGLAKRSPTTGTSSGTTPLS